MPRFNLSRIIGHWYEVEKSFSFPEIATGCTTMQFTSEASQKDPNIIMPRLEVAVKNINEWTGSPSLSLGYAEPEVDGSSIMNFVLSSRLPDAIARLLPGSGRYQILYTDYSTFAILWSCANFGIAHTDQIWVLGRDRDFDAQTRKIIYDALEQLGLGSDRLVLSRNKNCPAVFNPSTNVIQEFN